MDSLPPEAFADDGPMPSFNDDAPSGVHHVARPKVQPQDLGAEAAVMSAVLLSQEALDEAATVVEPRHFYADANRRILEAEIGRAHV